MLGNHRDAWVFGAADASSGTAAMMELSRVLGEQLKKGMPCSGQSTMFTKKDLNITLRFTLSRGMALCPLVIQDLS